MRRALSSRAVFIILSLITAVLLFGSMVLQNVYFKADQVDSSLYISPTTFSRKPNSSVTLQVKAKIQGAAVIAGAQFYLEYDQSLLEFSETTATPPFTSLQSVADEGVVAWTLLPSTESGTTVQLSGEVTFGSVTFKTIAEGQATVRFRQSDSSITAIDSSRSPALYNAIVSIQDSSGIISERNGEAAKPTETLTKSAEVLPTFSAQKVLRNEPVVSDVAAKLLVSLKYVGGVSVRFGTTSDLPLTIEASELSQHHLIDFSALEPETRYYYQLIVYSEDKKTSLKTQTKSFVTSSAGGGIADQKLTSVAVLPEVATKTAKVVIAARDDQGKVSSEQLTVVPVSGSAQVIEQRALNGITVATISSTITTNQSVALSVRAGEREVAQAKLTFDPSIADHTEPMYKFPGPIQITPNNAALLFLVAAGMILFGMLFIRLARSK
jgi:hypothetical protein